MDPIIVIVIASLCVILAASAAWWTHYLHQKCSGDASVQATIDLSGALNKRMIEIIQAQSDNAVQQQAAMLDYTLRQTWTQFNRRTPSAVPGSESISIGPNSALGGNGILPEEIKRRRTASANREAIAAG